MSLTLADLEDDPYPHFARLREHEPVAWIPSAKLWLVTRYNDCVAILRDSETFTTDSPNSLIGETFGPQMLSLDGAEHRRHRKPCNATFNPHYVRQAFTKAISAFANRLIGVFESDGTAELRGAFASPLAVQTVGMILGLPPGDTERIRRWYDDFAAALSNFQRDSDMRDRGLRTSDDFRAYLRAARFGAEQEGSLLGALSAAPEERLSDGEIASNAMLMLFGGIETTESMILNALWALLTHRAQLEEVLSDRALLPNALNESLRWDAAVQSCTRHAMRDVVVRDMPIHQGDTVQCMLGAANRDPDHFAEPDVFDIRRGNASEHLTFGYGRHLCISKHLALLEAEIGLSMLFNRLPGLDLDHGRLTPPRGHEFRKPPALHVRWTI